MYVFAKNINQDGKRISVFGQNNGFTQCVHVYICRCVFLYVKGDEFLVNIVSAN